MKTSRLVSFFVVASVCGVCAQSEAAAQPPERRKSANSTRSNPSGTTVGIEHLISPDSSHISVDFLDSLEIDPSSQPQVQAALNSAAAKLKKIQSVAAGATDGKIALSAGSKIRVDSVPAPQIAAALDAALRKLPEAASDATVTLKAAFEQHLTEAFGEGYEISVTLDPSKGRGHRRTGSGPGFIVSIDTVVDGVPSGKPHQIGSWLKGTRYDIFELQSASSKRAAGQLKSAESSIGLGSEQLASRDPRSPDLPEQAGKVRIGFEVFARLLEKGTVTLPVFDASNEALSKEFISTLQIAPSEEREVMKAARLFENNWRSGEVKRSRIQTDPNGERKLCITDVQGQRNDMRKWALEQFSDLLDGPRNGLMLAAFLAHWNSPGDAVLLSINELPGDRCLHVETIGSNGQLLTASSLACPSGATLKDFPRWAHLHAVTGQPK